MLMRPPAFVDRWQRRRVDRTRVLVLSGGGVNGAYQAGLLQPLVASGWVPDHIVGVSAGALNGVWLGSNWNAAGVAELGGIWRSLDQRPIFHDRRLSQLVHLLRRKDALQSAEALEQIIDEFCPVADLADSQTPVHVGATNLNTGAAAWFSAGPAKPRLLASAAVPGVIAPVLIGATFFVDGGALSNVPILRAAELGNEFVVLDVGGTPTDEFERTAFGVFARSYAQCRRSLAQTQLELAQRTNDLNVFHVSADLPADLRPTQWERSDELLERGHDQMSTLLRERSLV